MVNYMIGKFQVNGPLFLQYYYHESTLIIGFEEVHIEYFVANKTPVFISYQSWLAQRKKDNTKLLYNKHLHDL